MTEKKKSGFDLFGLLKSNKNMTTEQEKQLTDESIPIEKRYKLLAKFTENGDVEEVKKFYSVQYSLCYKIFLDSLQQFDTLTKQKNNPTKFIPTQDIISLAHMLLALLKYARHMVAKKWQVRSIVHYTETFLDPTNVYQVRKLGFELILNYVDIMQDNTDEKVLDTIMAVMDFRLFADPNVKLPQFSVRAIDEKERVKIQKAEKPITDAEQLTLISMFCSFIRTDEGQFGFWWKFFKSRVAPILYPLECQSLDLLNKLDDFGFRQPYICPHQIHQLVLCMILDCLENGKKSQVLSETDKDIYLMLLIFRQSFLFPPIYFEYTQKMLKVYRSWIVRDIFTYSWPDIMEKSRNVYYRVFVDNLLQTFYMKGDEETLDIHIAMSHEVLEIFLFFAQIPEKVEPETWKALLIAHLEIFDHLITRKTSQNKYDQDYGMMLSNTVIRNLFILWMKSNPQDDELWNLLNITINTHFAEDTMADFWDRTVINLCKALLSKIYGLPDDLVGKFLNYDIEKYILEKKKGKISVKTKKYGSSIKEFLMKQDPRVLLHLFHRMCSMFGDKAEAMNGKLHAKKIKTISDALFLFINMSHQEVKVPKGFLVPTFIHATEGNKLLQLFGSWLFDASERQDTQFYDGRALAYKTLCRLFCQKFSQPWNKTYLSYFYRAIHLGLTKATIEIRDCIILNSTELFALQLPGSNIVVPDFLKAIETMFKTKSSSKELKLSALTILTSIIPLCYYFGDVDLCNIDTVKFEEEEDKNKNGTEEKEDVSYHNFVSIRDKILKIFFSNVSDDSFEAGQIRCMWGLFTILNKDLNQGLTNNIPKPIELKPILDCISSYVMHPNQSLAFASHDVINTLCHLGLLPQLGVTPINKVLNNACSAIITHLTEGQNLKPELLIDLYQTIAEVIIISPTETLTNVTVMDDIFTCVALGLAKDKIAKALGGSTGSQSPSTPVDESKKLKKDDKKSSSMLINTNSTISANKGNDQAKDIHDAAMALLNFITNTLNSFPNPIGPTCISSNASEFEFLHERNGQHLPSQKVLHFAFNGNALLTILEKPGEPNTARFICRDMTGRHTWDYHLVYRPEENIFKWKEGQEKQKKKKFELNIKLDGEPTDTTQVKEEDKVPSREPSPAPQTDVVTSENKTPDFPQDLPPQIPMEGAPEIPTDGPPEIPSDLPPDVPSDLPPPLPDTMPEGVEEEYPKFAKDIDTDKTDMLDILSSFISQVFPECLDFRKAVVTEIGEQKIDIASEETSHKQHTELEMSILKETPLLPFPVLKHPVKQTLEHPIFRAFRTFMNTMGFTRQGNIQTFYRLHVDSKFYKSLKTLDRMSERETVRIGVVYVANGQESASEIFKNNKASNLFNEFVEALGWQVNLASHLGYTGGIDPNNTLGDYAPYYSNATTEVIFHVTTQMTSKVEDPQNLFKKRLLGNDYVHIVWSEHDRNYRAWTIPSPQIYYQIVIYPIRNSGLYRIAMYSKPDMPQVGPLTNGLVVDKFTLGPLVRMTAMNANHAVKLKLKSTKKPYTQRKEFMDEIINKWKPVKQEEYKDFLKPLFLFVENEEEPSQTIGNETSEKEDFKTEVSQWEPEDENKCKPMEEKKRDDKEVVEYEME